MSQFRKDVFTGRSVIVAGTEAVRARDFRFKKFTGETTFCPFCEPMKLLHRPKSGPQTWRLVGEWAGLEGPRRPQFAASLRIEGDLSRRPEGFHDMMNGIGTDEVIVETPRHTAVCMNWM